MPHSNDCLCGAKICALVRSLVPSVQPHRGLPILRTDDMKFTDWLAKERDRLAPHHEELMRVVAGLDRDKWSELARRAREIGILH
jgi:hypothetical protein